MNNYQKHLKQIEELKGRPQLLIHICCGVCSVYPLQYLRKYFDITIFFSNSNIYPYEEYERRLNALKTYLSILNDDSIRLIEDHYDNEAYMENLVALKDEPEGGRRCRLCYRLRMERTFAYAKKHHYPYATTVMSISNRKNADWLNEIGEDLQRPEIGNLAQRQRDGQHEAQKQRTDRHLNGDDQRSAEVGQPGQYDGEIEFHRCNSFNFCILV